jgi:hypothetical protein
LIAIMVAGSGMEASGGAAIFGVLIRFATT